MAYMLVEAKEDKRQAMRCAIDLTTNAKTSLLKWFETEQVFFNLEKEYHLFIEKRPENRQGNTSYYLYFHNETNGKLKQVLNNRVAVLECVIENQALLAIGFQVRGHREVIETNRRYETYLSFVLNERHIAATLPIDLYTALRSLPVAEERSQYVEKRISSWEGYLKMQELNADVEDIETTYGQSFVHDDEEKLTMTCSQLNAKTFRQIEGFNVSIAGLSGDVGQVTTVKPGKKMIEISLSPQYRRRAKRHEVNFQDYQTVTFNNFAELSQVRRLRKGFKDLQKGLAANPNLEKVLFEERPVVKITNKKQSLHFHSRLNEYQREAVEGAMNAHDLYVIQGPPGTGKTTVIAEICYQNAKAGLKTLVASQANLAVDNALGRLLNDPDIRILRYGRTESIEEEGRKFIEENVAEHWKDQTITQIEQTLANIVAHKKEIEKTCHSLRNQAIKLEEERQEVIAQVEQKEQAIKRLEKLFMTREEQQAEEERITQALEKHRFTIGNLEENITAYTTAILEIRSEIEYYTLSEDEHEQVQNNRRTKALLERSIDYMQAEQRLKTLREKHEHIEEMQQQFQKNQIQMEQFVEQSNTLHKHSLLMEAVTQFELELPESLHIQLEKLDRDLFVVKEKMNGYEKSEWEIVDERLIKAIPMLEEVLKKQGFFTDDIHKRPIRYRFKTAGEVDDFLNRMGSFLVQPKTKEMLATRNFSGEKFDALERIADAYTLLQNVRAQIRYEHRELQSIQQEIIVCKERFEQLKAQVIQIVQTHTSSIPKEREDALEQKQKLSNQIDEQKNILAKIDTSDIRRESLNTLIEEQAMMIAAIEKVEEKERQYHLLQDQLSSTETKLVDARKKTQQTNEEVQQLENAYEQVLTTLNTLYEEEQTLKEVAESKPEEALNELIGQQHAVELKLQEQSTLLQQYPAKEQIQQQWLTMLQEATPYDLQEIKKIYIQHANVIGTTCVASARKEFMDTYPTFDVVIIDEVSKATPPELLLPMLKGKKVILVGDHHQLPPLIGQETMEEFLETIENNEDRKELAKLLRESLFERLFRTLPKQNKTMLGIQYRMHETIMNTITPFYNEDGYTLQCGLDNSDEQRDHLLESEHIARTDRLLWFDIPNEKPYFEERVKGGTSRFNTAELARIRQLLIELNDATAKAITEGRMAVGMKKHVGIISFYGEQVKRVNRLIEHELHLPYLHCRTGSVDKFQGMEMDVILLSFVRNNDHPGGDIGFAKDYRRLNVALSRAKELLVIIGSSKMFMKRPKQLATREMFERLYDQVDKQHGLKQLPLEVDV